MVSAAPFTVSQLSSLYQPQASCMDPLMWAHGNLSHIAFILLGFHRIPPNQWQIREARNNWYQSYLSLAMDVGSRHSTASAISTSGVGHGAAVGFVNNPLAATTTAATTTEFSTGTTDRNEIAIAPSQLPVVGVAVFLEAIGLAEEAPDPESTTEVEVEQARFVVEPNACTVAALELASPDGRDLGVVLRWIREGAAEIHANDVLILRREAGTDYIVKAVRPIRSVMIFFEGKNWRLIAHQVFVGILIRSGHPCHDVFVNFGRIDSSAQCHALRQPRALRFDGRPPPKPPHQRPFIQVLGEKMGLPEEKNRLSFDSSAILGCCQLGNSIAKRFAALEFDRMRKSMGVIVKSNSGSNSLLVKGAVENLLERSSYIQLQNGTIVPLDEKTKGTILATLTEMSTNVLCCLSFAYKDDLAEFATYHVGLRDPPREEVYDAIEDCRAAGINVKVITRDNKETAEAICHEIGVFVPEEDINLKSFTGKEFMALENKKAPLRRKGGLRFSRAELRHKQEIVRLLKEDGEVIAMSGDGVNDALALKLVDIGIAIGITGNEVAQEAFDMVLADDSFSTIVSAVGAYIRYMISSSIGEVASIFLTSALGIPEGLIPVQLLWVNLVTVGPLATAFGFNPTDKDIMKKPPRRSNNSLITPWILFCYLVIGLYVGVAIVGVFIIWCTHGSFMGIDLSGDGHTLVSYSQFSNWGQCSTWEDFNVAPFTAGARRFTFENPYEYLQAGKMKATTLSLFVLVAIEMFNSLMTSLCPKKGSSDKPEYKRAEIQGLLEVAFQRSSGGNPYKKRVNVYRKEQGAVPLSAFFMRRS